MKQKKQIWKRWMPILALALLVTMAFGMNAAAASSTVSMKKNSSGVYAYTDTKSVSRGVVYHKFSASSSGLIAVSGSTVSPWGGTSSISFKLCDSKKREISKASTVNAGNNTVVYYGVKKGTYYLMTSGVSRPYAVAAAFAKTTDKGGSKKSKALNVKKNKTTLGILPIGEKGSTADWYKFKVTKNQVLRLYFENIGNGYMDFTIYGPSYKKGYRICRIKNVESSHVSSSGSRQSKVKKGTYYIKVSRASNNKYTSGAYSIKWK